VDGSFTTKFSHEELILFIDLLFYQLIESTILLSSGPSFYGASANPEFSQMLILCVHEF
jgi:hypothetical protein